MEVRRLPESELYHHGIKGQKWGVRRYQNPDGSLTAAGQARYTYNERKKSLKTVSNMSSEDMQKQINRMRLEKQYRQTTKENLRDTRNDSNSTLKTVGKVAAGAAIAVGGGLLLNRALRTGNRYAAVAKGISTLTDKELATKISRLKLEQTYSNLSNDSINRGKSVLNGILENAGTTVLASAITGATAYALKSAITGSVDANEAAQYIAPNPKGSKKR